MPVISAGEDECRDIFNIFFDPSVARPRVENISTKLRKKIAWSKFNNAHQHSKEMYIVNFNLQDPTGLKSHILNY